MLSVFVVPDASCYVIRKHQHLLHGRKKAFPVQSKILGLYFLLCGCTERRQIRLHCGIISTVLCVDSVIELCHSSKHCARQKASHTNKGSHKTPPKHLTVSIVRRHENPCSRAPL